MRKFMPESIHQTIETLFREESRRVFATLVRLLGDFDLAEDATHEAFTAALEQWASEGVPANPRAWLVSTGRFKALDVLRRRAKLQDSLAEFAMRLPSESDSEINDIEDDRLRLIFTCCHPAIAPNIQIALTLREICGLKTEDIARAFLIDPTAMAQRIVRGKAKIRDAGIPYQIPTLDDLPERLDSVLSVIYLVFNEGYSASSGDSLTRADLSEEAIRLARLLVELLPDPEAMGLLALMLLQESRRQARSSAWGDIILLEHQDRSQWDPHLIAEGKQLIEQSLASQGFGFYTLQAAISAVHADAPSANQTDWAQLVALYDVLYHTAPTPIVELNRAVALAMRDGPSAGLLHIDRILSRGDLADYHLAHAARADLCRRLGRTSDARDSYARALTLAQQEPERRFLQNRLDEMRNQADEPDFLGASRIAQKQAR